MCVYTCLCYSPAVPLSCWAVVGAEPVPEQEQVFPRPKTPASLSGYEFLDPELCTVDTTATDVSAFPEDGQDESMQLQEGTSANMEEPLTEEPRAEEPMGEEPKAEESKVAEPTTEEPKTKKAKVEEPTTEEPMAEEPKAEESKVAEPMTEEPKTKKSKVEQPMTEELMGEEPKAEESKVEEPMTEEPTTREPKAKERTTEESKEEPGVEVAVVPSAGKEMKLAGERFVLMLWSSAICISSCVGVLGLSENLFASMITWIVVCLCVVVVIVGEGVVSTEWSYDWGTESRSCVTD